MATPRRRDPEPFETDDVPIVTLGTALWAAALVAALLLSDRLAEQGRERWVWVAAAGLFLGLVGVRRARRHRAGRRAGPGATGDD